MTVRWSLLLSLVLGLASYCQAGETVFNSGTTRTNLLELYTSEGCSSCPPAESWLSGLKSDSRLWRDFVPVAFHVDYWDRLGWRDPFSSKAWTARQSQYAAHWKNESVYTPGFVLNGSEWQDRRAPAKTNENVGVLKITLHENDRLSASFEPVKAGGRTYEINVARLGFDLTTDVRAGENSGRKLRHDFVVLSLAKEPVGAGVTELRLATGPPSTSAPHQAIAAWITETGQVEPLQAVGGWLP